ncbi:putative uncharacterized protein [Parachlamydia acanthamoebae UV-7]|uniref:Uncharacterized protein n=2 Tax=Parachlamydia acanthamoebae TaxID=83552 RepID=F8L085_PARAV|nr:hypothetical protein [Parachlamydia acanthamoebae]KIA77668.1 hypothetical protein DB43_GA00020 [Parachlamydia acanthamoebae]CCB86615.1 putative uncharacterized protein [Parachlamydia acanthamoebae UV-7]
MTSIQDTLYFFRGVTNSYKTTNHQYLKVDPKSGNFQFEKKSKRSSLRKISAYVKTILENQNVEIQKRKQLASYFKIIVDSCENKKKNTPKILFLKNWISNLIKKHQIAKSRNILTNFENSYASMPATSPFLNELSKSPHFKNNKDQALDALKKAPIGTHVMWQKELNTLIFALSIPAYESPIITSKSIDLDENAQTKINRLAAPENQFEILLNNKMAFTSREELQKKMPQKNRAYAILKTDNDTDYEMVVKTKYGFANFTLTPSENETLFELIEKNLIPEKLEEADIENLKRNDDMISKDKNHVGHVAAIQNPDGSYLVCLKIDKRNTDHMFGNSTAEKVNDLKTEAGFRQFLNDEGYFFASEEEARANCKKNEFVLWKNQDKTISMLVEDPEGQSYLISDNEDIRLGMQKAFEEFEKVSEVFYEG